MEKIEINKNTKSHNSLETTFEVFKVMNIVKFRNKFTTKAIQNFNVLHIIKNKNDILSFLNEKLLVYGKH